MALLSITGPPTEPSDETCSVLYQAALERLPQWLGNPNSCRPLWVDEDAELQAGIESIVSGAVTIVERPDLDLAIGTLASTRRSSGHRFVGRTLAAIHPWQATHLRRLGTMCTYGTCGTLIAMSMATRTSAGFALGREFKAREARDHLKEVLDRAEAGGVSVIRRGRSPVVVLDRDTLGATLQASTPVPVLSSVTKGQFAFWVDGAPIHAVGDDLDAAEDEFLDALIDYAEAWFDRLHNASNHRQHRNLAFLVAIYAGDRPELHRVIFGDG